MYRWSTQSLVLTCARTQRASFPQLLPFSFFANFSLHYLSEEQDLNNTIQTSQNYNVGVLSFIGVVLQGLFYGGQTGWSVTQNGVRLRIYLVWLQNKAYMGLCSRGGLGKALIPLIEMREGVKIVFGTPITPNPVFYSAIPWASNVTLQALYRTRKKKDGVYWQWALHV